MAYPTLIPQSEQQEDLHLLPQTNMDESLWRSLRDNFRAALFPEKLPPLVLTSRPVKVREIWGEYDYKKESAGVSAVVHVAMVAGLIGLSIMGARAIKQDKPPETVTLIAPDLTPQLPMTKKKEQTSGGGGGGGDRDKLQAPKGKLPKLAMEQITPPAIVIRNDHPKLPVEPTVVVPPQLKLASNMPNIGNPLIRQSPRRHRMAPAAVAGLVRAPVAASVRARGRALVLVTAVELVAEYSAWAGAYRLRARWIRPIQTIPKKLARRSIRELACCG